ncbi:Ubiquitin ligase-binding protein BUL1 [Candida viswanathii]|uniref:Ubiquitin ligase-binding protein BUL1 n=1 Tax=Candida viswanathii TaxID=5486 RepID=A0A367Y4M2_9ASCO|nr:Ubiquitin ligase-binding protein BUL1 [Candida viswanathii]
MSPANQSQSIDDTINTILPSYDMFTSTVGKTLDTHNDEDDDLQPPCYNNTVRNNSYQSDVSSATATSDASAGLNTMSLSSSRTSVEESMLQGTDENGSFIVADESTCYWKETILDNVHRLPNLTFEKHKVSEAVNIEVHFTKDICEIGKKPELIDPHVYEFNQGDLLNGYVIIQNRSDKPIHYDMFYLLFEGNFMVANPANLQDRVPVKIRKFLEMFDFSASWNEGNINRLVTDVRNPYVCEDIRDPIDGAALCFGDKKFIYPGITYKRFFTFRIPNNLLDSECNEHGLSKHVELPPTMGMPRWEIAHFPERARNKIKDFSMLDTSVSYGVMARFIGRKSTWESDFGEIKITADNTRLINAKGDEYVILKELTNHFRIVPKTPAPTDSERSMKLLENKLMYNNFILRIKEKIDQGNQLIESIEAGNFTGSVEIGRRLSETELELAKCSQLYRPDNIRDAKFNPDRKEYYETFLPLVKKSITGTKSLGTLQLSTPKKEYCICYIPPIRFRQGSIDKRVNSWKFDIPLDLSVKFPSISTKSPNVPTIKGISAEFVVVTLRSDKYAIPIELNHDLLFNKVNTGQFHDNDNVFNNLISPIRQECSKLYSIAKSLGAENFRMEKQLVDDLKAIGQLKQQSLNLVVRGLKVNGKTFNKDSVKWTVNQESAHASVTLGIDLEGLMLKGELVAAKLGKAYDRFSLVPNFQSCYMSRMYHIRLTVHLSNGAYSNIKVPVRVGKV